MSQLPNGVEVTSILCDAIACADVDDFQWESRLLRRHTGMDDDQEEFRPCAVFGIPFDIGRFAWYMKTYELGEPDSDAVYSVSSCVGRTRPAGSSDEAKRLVVDELKRAVHNAAGAE